MLLQSQFDSLPYIDKDNEQSLELAREEIQKSIASSASTQLHPLLEQLPLQKSFLSDSVQKEIDLLESKKQTKLSGGIDVNKYTNLQDSKGNLKIPEAYIALEYSKIREENLALLSEFGKNQWLIGNDQLEKNLKLLEQELVDTKEETDSINSERKRKQSEIEPTLSYLETRWKDSIKGLVDVNVANLRLEGEIKKIRKE